MNDDKQPLKFSYIRLWHPLATLILLGLAVHLLLPQIASLESSLTVIKEMIWWAVLMAAIAQVLSYLGAGFMVRAILKNNHQTLSIVKGALITMASASIGLVAGDWVGDAAAMYGWVRQEVNDNNAATLAGTLPPILNTALLAVVTLLGVIYLLAIHDLGATQLLEFGIVLLILTLVFAGIAATFYFRTTTTRLVVWLAGRWAALRRKPYDPQTTVAAVTQFYAAWNSLRGGIWRGPVLGALANIGFDMATLYFMFIAAGYDISPVVVFAGYGLPFIIGKMAFLIPGGVGVIEVSMVAIFNSLQVPNSISVIAILGYRLLSFWLPALLGFAAAGYLGGKSPSTAAEQPEF